MSKKVSAQFRRNCTGWDWKKEEVRSLVLRKNLNCQSLLLTVFFLCRIPITGPQFQSALNASCSYLQVLGSPTCPCKLLKTLVVHTLKRLASAVQLRPWPPHFKAVNCTFHFAYYPQFTRSCPHYCTKPVTGAVFSRFLTGSGSAAFLPRNNNSRNIPCASSLSSVTAFA